MPAPADPAARTSDRAGSILLASSNPGKLSEYRAMALADSLSSAVALELFPRFSEPPEFEESAPTFAENAVGKAIHYSGFTEQAVLADDSGLAVAALGGAPGVRSARYAGPGASDAARIAKLLEDLRDVPAGERGARFVCVIVLAQRGRVIGVFSDHVEGEILDAPRGQEGFGYDPVFFVAALGKTFAEIPREEKNLHSHRGKAFRKACGFWPLPLCYSSGTLLMKRGR